MSPTGAMRTELEKMACEFDAEADKLEADCKRGRRSPALPQPHRSAPQPR
jgi:hypothetical protein